MVATDASGGGVTLISTGDITIGSVNETHDAQNWSHNAHSGFLSKETVNDSASSHHVIAAGSTVSGDTVTGASGHDITISGSTVAATHDVTLAAANNLTINTTQDTSESSTFHEHKKSGFGALSGGGMTVSYANSNQKDAAHDSSVTNNASLIGSTHGSVNLAAGNDLHVTGSDLIAAQNITGTGANVIIDAATGTTHHDETHERKQSGFTAGLAGSVGDALNNAVSQSEGVSRNAGSGDSRAAALHGIAAASDAYTVGSAAAGAATGKGVPDIGVQVSFGSAKSSSGASEDQTLNSGSNVQAGGAAAFVATGNGTPGSGNLTIAGSNVSANDVILAAKDTLNIVNTTDTDWTRSSNSSNRASVGVSVTTMGGAGISASMQNAHGDANSDAAMQNASHVSGANSVTVVSGGDTNIIGSQVNGRQITADVGGDLSIASVQDLTTSAAHQSSAGGGIGIRNGGAGASFSDSHGKASGEYAGINEQAGIHAGAGGFDITVKGNTDLKGAVIASDATPDKNTLTTGTLSFSDIANSSSYDAKSSGFSAGGSLGLPDKSVGPSSVPNSGGITPSLSQQDSGNDSASTRSAVSAGTINVTDSADQTQDVASLNRDTSNTNGAVAKTPDVNALLDKQADMMNAAQAAGQAVAQRIGDYAQSKYKEAEANHDQAGMDAWRDGGPARAEMQAAGAALVGGLGGGMTSAAGSAAGAGLASISAGKLNELSDSIASSSPTGNADMDRTLGNIVANVIATGAGAAVGGDAGATTAANVDRYNRQLHPDEYATAKKDAKIVAQQLGISEQEAEGRIVAEILRNSDQQTSQDSGGKKDYEVRSIVGCQNLNCDGYKNDPNYADHSYNGQYIASNQSTNNAGQQQLNAGMTDAEMRQQNLAYERTGKAAIALTACLVSGGTACKAAATELGITTLTNYATGKPVTTAEVIGGFVGGGIGGIYGANLTAWMGEAGGLVEKTVLGITKFAPTYAGKQAGIPLGNATNLGGSVDPLLDPATNSWWGLKNTVDNLKSKD